MSYSVHIGFGFHVNCYHSYRGDTNDKFGFGGDIRIMRHTLSQDHGARVDTIVPGVGGLDRGGANNLIAPGAICSINAPGEVTSGFLVGVEKVDVFELARQYPEAFGRAYDEEQGLIVESRLAGEEA